MDFFTRHADRDDKLAARASGDIDMIISPRDNMLVVVAQSEDGVHTCGLCLDPFVDEATHPLRPVEFTPPGLSDDGQNFGTRILVHAKCVKPASRRRGNLVDERVRGHQARRFLTKALKPFSKD